MISLLDAVEKPINIDMLTWDTVWDTIGSSVLITMGIAMNVDMFS